MISYAELKKFAVEAEKLRHLGQNRRDFVPEFAFENRSLTTDVSETNGYASPEGEFVSINKRNVSSLDGWTPTTRHGTEFEKIQALKHPDSVSESKGEESVQ